jgi:hypothetical protein
MTSQEAKAKSNYRYTTCVFMSTFMTENTSTHLSPSSLAAIVQCVVVDKYHRDS